MEMSGVRYVSEIVRKITCQNKKMTVPARLGSSDSLLACKVHVCGRQLGPWGNELH